MLRLLERAVVCYNEKVEGVALGPDQYPPVYALSCMTCGHSVDLHHNDAREIWGDGTTARAMARSLVCLQCGERRGRIMLVTNSQAHGPSPYFRLRPRTVRIQKWLRSRLSA